MGIKIIIQKIISLFLCKFKNVQDFFVITKDKVEIPGLNNNRVFYDIDNIDDFNKICSQYNFTVEDANAENRFLNKCHFCVITEDDYFGCWGWYTTSSSKFNVLEIDRKLPVPENASILFHYYTNSNYRRKGFYTQLLKNVVLSCGKEYSIIYAYDTNPASSTAIKKAGFYYAGRYSHKTFKCFEKLISDYNAEVTRN